jgi:hypothetical protein
MAERKHTHTRGPWRIFDTGDFKLRTGDCILHPQIWTGSGARIAFCEEQNVGTETAIANARLIAAAPELLEACKEFVRVMEDQRTTASMPATVKMAKAAIQKAEAQS